MKAPSFKPLRRLNGPKSVTGDSDLHVLAVENEQLGFEVSEDDLLVSDTPEFTGRAIAHLAMDPRLSARSGQTFPVVQLAHEYGFTDIDGRLPAMDDHTRAWAAKLAAINRLLNEA